MTHVAESIAPQVPGYDTVQKIGQGGMGEVYLGKQHSGDRAVAIKFLTPQPQSREREQKLRFARESRLVAGLDHPNIVTVIDSGTASDRDYFVMEYVAGGSLRNSLTPGQPLDSRQTRSIVGQVARALDYLHRKGIVHRDLKPENVLMDSAGRVKIADFGISAPLSEMGAVTCSGQFLGTMDYMAPEQRARLTVDQRADQFALAVIAYEMLTGKRPLGNFKLPSQLNPRLSRGVDAVLVKALQEDPEDRYPGVLQFDEALGSALSKSPARNHRRLIVTASGAAALAAATTLAVMARLRSPLSHAVSEPPPILSGTEQSLPGTAAVAFPTGLSETDTTTATGPLSDDAAEPVKDRAAAVAYFLELAERHASKGVKREADIAYTEAVRLAPHDPSILLKRAQFYKKFNLPQQALDDLDAVLQLSPDCAEARLGRGTIYVNLKDYARGIEALDEAIRADPADARAVAYRGWARHGLGQEEQAEQDLNAAVALDADCGVAYQFRGLWSNSRGDYRQAQSDFENSIRCTPDNPYAHSALALLLATCKDKSLRDGPRSVEHAVQACELTHWREWSQLRILASAYSQNGDAALAVRWCETALQTAPEISHRGLREQLQQYRKQAAGAGESPQ